MSTNNLQKIRFSVVDTKRDLNLQYEENTNTKGYVSWGRDNQYPQHVTYLAKNSATVKAIIEGSVRYICGNGLVIPDDAAKWSKTVNRQGETLEDIVEQVAGDLLLLNGFAVQVIYNKLGAVSELYALDFARCRSNANNSKIYYSRKWGVYQTSKYEEYDAFNPEKIDPEKLTQIYFYKGSSRKVYPIPSWEGAFRDAQTEIEASKLQLNDMANGLNAKVIITLPDESGALSEEEKNAVEEAIATKFTGSEATSSFFLTWKTEGIGDVKVDVIKQDDDSNKFETIKKSARENIFVSFRATPNLFGLPTATTGFNEQEYKGAYQLFDRTVIAPLRARITRVLNQILRSQQGIKIIPFDLFNENEEE